MSESLTLPPGWAVSALAKVTASQSIGTGFRGAGRGASIPMLKMGNLVWGGLDLRNLEPVAEETALAAQCLLQEGDILFNTRNSPELVGKTAYWPGNIRAAFDNNIMRIRLNGSALPKYVARWMSSERGKRAIARLVSASTSVGAVYWRDLSRLQIPLPPLPEQRRIAAILDAWDEAIAHAEQLAVRKQERFNGLIQQLLVNSAAPRKELETFSKLVSDKISVHGAPFEASIELEDVESGSGRLIGHTRSAGLAGQRVRFRPGDVLFSKLRPYLKKFHHPEVAGMASTEMWVLRADPNLCADSYLYYLVRSPKFLAEANRPTGSRMPRADWDWVRRTPLPLPPVSEQRRIACLLGLAERELNSLADLSRSLAEQRCGLMQKLLTGELRVPESLDSLLPGRPDAGCGAEAAR